MSDHDDWESDGFRFFTGLLSALCLTAAAGALAFTFEEILSWHP